MRICGRCDKPIRPTQAHTAYDIPSPTGPGTTVFLHVAPCPKAPFQTTQQRRPPRH
ncbi:hypothetical protein QFZ75_003705 [Streptomyces sp. V3I8]|nr:hypothetical protein [Streptomyces sp. V3I8]